MTKLKGRRAFRISFKLSARLQSTHLGLFEMGMPRTVSRYIGLKLLSHYLYTQSNVRDINFVHSNPVKKMRFNLRKLFDVSPGQLDVSFDTTLTEVGHAVLQNADLDSPFSSGWNLCLVWFYSI